MGNVEKYVSMDEIMDYFGVSRESVMQFINKGMPAHKLGRLWKFKFSEVDKWVQSGAGKLDESDNNNSK